jgi:hypothetical protein
VFTPRYRTHGKPLAWLVCGVLVAGMWMLSACEKPAVVDLPASALTTTITVIDTDDSPSDGKVPIVVQFFSAGKQVELAGNATVSCNGVAMGWTGGLLGYGERVPMVPAGGNYACVHHRNGVNATVNIAAPARPVITSPSSGANVARSNSLTIQYVPDGGTKVSASAGDGSKGLGGNDQADTGTYTGFDVTTLAAGPGSLGLTRDLTLAPGGTGFQSAKIAYSSGADITVTWQ